MGGEETEKSENGHVNGGAQLEEKPKIEDSLSTTEAQEQKVRYPKSVFFIISNEFCERFSYYGMRTILSLYLRDMLKFSESDSTVIYHTFVLLCYFFPVIGAIISDSWLGKFRTILYVSMIYAAGNILLALASAEPLNIPQVPFSLLALVLIALGTGGIKPCVSAFGGDQFVLPQQAVQLAAFFSVFYFSINAGSLISTFLTPVLREDVKCFDQDTCFPLAFGVPGILMIVSIVIFFAGMPLYKIRKPEGNIVVEVVKCIWYGAKKNIKSKEKVEHWLDHAEEKFGRNLVEDVKVTLKVLIVFIPLPIFWACYDQQGSAWTFQATRMDGRLGATTILPDQMQVVNPLLILLFIPLFTYVVYPFFNKYGILTTPLQKMVCGGFLTAIAFGISAGLSAALEASLPEMPTDGICQLRVYNPHNCEATLQIDGLLNTNTKIDPMGYKYFKLDCVGTKNYSYTVNHCLFDSTSGLNGTGIVEIAEATGYVLYPSSKGFLVVEDDISKPEDGFPKLRILVDNPDIGHNITLFDEDEVILTTTSFNNSLQTLDPGTYTLENLEVEVNLGGVYTLLVAADANVVKNISLVEVTEHNSIHMLVTLPQYIIITAGEILFSITGLEFSYSQAPVTMKSVLTAAFLLTSAFGNLIIVIIESIKIFDRQSLDFTLYTCLMVVDMVIFAFMARNYTYVKKKESEDDNIDAKSEKRPSNSIPVKDED